MTEAVVDLEARVARFLSEARARDEPYALLNELRERDPVHQLADGAWLICNYEGNQSLMREKGWTHVNPALARIPVEQMGRARQMTTRMILFNDPPEHTRMRRLLGRAFLKSAAEAKRPVFREHIEHLLQQCAPRGEVEFTQQVARLVPMHMICDLLGLPQERYDDLVYWGSCYTALFAVDVTREVEAEADRAFAEFAGYLQPILAELRRNPRPCLLSEWLDTERSGELSADEMVGSALFVMVGGHVTTTYLMSNAVYTLLQHPDQWQLLKDEPALVPKAVEEVLRFNSSSRGLSARWATEDLVLCGKTIRKGDCAFGITAAADRDPAFFPNPDVFDIRRERNFHLAFGNGPHVCSGQFVARVEAQEMLHALMRHLPDIEIAGEVEFEDAWILRGLSKLPLRWAPRELELTGAGHGSQGGGHDAGSGHE